MSTSITCFYCTIDADLLKEGYNFGTEPLSFFKKVNRDKANFRKDIVEKSASHFSPLEMINESLAKDF